MKPSQLKTALSFKVGLAWLPVIENINKSLWALGPREEPAEGPLGLAQYDLWLSMVIHLKTLRLINEERPGEGLSPGLGSGWGSSEGSAGMRRSVFWLGS